MELNQFLGRKVTMKVIDFDSPELIEVRELKKGTNMSTKEARYYVKKWSNMVKGWIRDDQGTTGPSSE